MMKYIEKATPEQCTKKLLKKNLKNEKREIEKKNFWMLVARPLINLRSERQEDFFGRKL